MVVCGFMRKLILLFLLAASCPMTLFADESNPRLILSQFGSPARDVQFNSDGTKLFFFRHGNGDDGSAGVFAQKTDGSNPVRLSTYLPGSSSIQSFMVTPDEKNIVYEVGDYLGDLVEDANNNEFISYSRIFVVPINGGRSKELSSQTLPEIDSAQLKYLISPASDVIYMALGLGGLYSVSLETGKITHLVSGSAWQLRLTDNPQWALFRDGGYISSQTLYSLNLVTGETYLLSYNTDSRGHRPAKNFYDPVSGFVFYSTDSDRDGNKTVHKAPIDGGTPVEIGEQYVNNIQMHALSADGRRLFYSIRNSDGFGELYRLDVDSGITQYLATHRIVIPSKVQHVVVDNPGQRILVSHAEGSDYELTSFEMNTTSTPQSISLPDLGEGGFIIEPIVIGSSVIYLLSTDEPRVPGTLYESKLDGGLTNKLSPLNKVVRLTIPGYNFIVTPDENYVMFRLVEASGSSSLYRKPLAGGEAELVLKMSSVYWENRYAHGFSQDAKKMFISSEQFSEKHRIFIFDLDKPIKEIINDDKPVKEIINDDICFPIVIDGRSAATVCI